MVPIYQASLVQMCWQKKLGQNATKMLKNNINIFWLFPYLERKTTSFHRERGKMLAILKGQIMNSLNNQSKTGLWKWLFLSEYETLVHFPLISQINAKTCWLFCCVNCQESLFQQKKKCFNSRDRLYGENEHIYLRRLSGGMCFVPKNIAEDASVDW